MAHYDDTDYSEDFGSGSGDPCLGICRDGEYCDLLSHTCRICSSICNKPNVIKDNCSGYCREVTTSEITTGTSEITAGSSETSPPQTAQYDLPDILMVAVSIVALIILAVIVFLLYQRKRRREAKIKEKDVEKEAEQAFISEKESST